VIFFGTWGQKPQEENPSEEEKERRRKEYNER